VTDENGESDALRRRLATLTAEARRNEEAWRRAHRREMALLEAATLGDLLERLTTDLRMSYRLAAATLVLADPEHEIRHLLHGQGRPLTDYPAVLFVDSAHALAPQLVAGPWLGPFNRADHDLLFPANVSLRSVALLPLLRQDRLIGSINMGSDRGKRFTDEHATDFLRHLAAIAAFCLENAVNRARLIRSGLTDVLTGWHNRRYLQSRLREELARCRRERSALTCLMIDVDHFKRINDRHGHLAGDDVLRQVAQRIEGAVRDSDVAARYGGEEFVILLPGTPDDAGGLLAERIRRAVAEESFEIANSAAPLAVTVSIGVAEHRSSGETEDLKVAGERLLARADVALYEAKAGGRNGVAHAANARSRP
jgi:diguanylate cyclase (GGDEF)-like protein